MYVSTSGREDKRQKSRLLPAGQENPAANGPALPSPSTKKARKKAMKEVHSKILPELLCPHGWQKVYDKDLKLTYRALYFNTIEKNKMKMTPLIFNGWLNTGK